MCRGRHGPGRRLVGEVVVVLGVIRPRPEAGQRRRPLLAPGLLQELLEPNQGSLFGKRN